MKNKRFECFECLTAKFKDLVWSTSYHCKLRFWTFLLILQLSGAIMAPKKKRSIVKPLHLLSGQPLKFLPHPHPDLKNWATPPLSKSVLS